MEQSVDSEAAEALGKDAYRRSTVSLAVATGWVEYLDRNRLTQVELAVTFGVGQPTLSRWLNRDQEPGISQGLKLCELLGLSVFGLYGGTGPATPTLERGAYRG